MHSVKCKVCGDPRGMEHNILPDGSGLKVSPAHRFVPDNTRRYNIGAVIFLIGFVLIVVGLIYLGR